MLGRRLGPEGLEGLGFRLQGVSGLGCRAQEFGFLCSGFRVYASGFKIPRFEDVDQRFNEALMASSLLLANCEQCSGRDVVTL